MEMFRKLEHLTNEKMLRELHLFSLEKERQNGGEQEDGARLFL